MWVISGDTYPSTATNGNDLLVFIFIHYTATKNDLLVLIFMNYAATKYKNQVILKSADEVS